MGMDATITVLTANERRKTPRPPGLPEFELGSDWPDLESALQELGGPAGLALRGSKPVLEEELDTDDFFVATPALVKRINAALGEVADAELLEVIHRQRKGSGHPLRKYEHKGLLAAFDTLKAAYRLAARKGAYLEILFC